MKTAFFIRRLITLLAVCSVTALPALAQQKPDDIVRVNTTLVQTDFMVFDKQGNFVDGLKRDQFVLKVDGKPREFSFFDRLAAGSRSEEAQLAAARGTNVGGGPAPVPLDRGRTVMFFIDDLHLSAGNATYTRGMLKQFIEHDLKQNDQASIASASGQLGFLQQLTDNKAVLNAAADRLRSQRSSQQSAESPPMTEYKQILIEQHDVDLFEFFVNALIKEDPMLPRQTAGDMVRARAAQLIENAADYTMRVLSTLN